jgi:hypothetical protein
MRNDSRARAALILAFELALYGTASLVILACIVLGVLP